ncbi:rare lipoprotein A [Halopseudomonas litoralis]|uniref:Endolytic peptidoglycan transglycosylase RlpA n=2 Tax=Halopseudomonas litoralis TaxID=797277 RepID=A0A1H1MBC8_9GAMM|nr:rare lipoprotein A [Halopseudomonas litoralis]
MASGAKPFYSDLANHSPIIVPKHSKRSGGDPPLSGRRYRVHCKKPDELEMYSMHVTVKPLVALLLLAVMSGCSIAPKPGSGGQWVGHTEAGQASYYADKFQNRQTASGELYKAGRKTAAHRTLPFGSKVKVTNVRNGRSVVVRINDRGPFVRGRVIDLSRSSFARIGDISAGLLKVRIEVVR